MKKNNIIFGILLLLGGLLVLLQMFNIGTDVDLVPALGSLLLLALSFLFFSKRFFLFGFLPLAGIIYIWREKLNFPDLNLWYLILGSFLLGLGVTLLFGKKALPFHHSHDPHSTHFSSHLGTDTDEVVSIETNFGDQTRYIQSTNLKYLNIDCNFSGVKVYFDQCQIHPNGATIHVDCNFSGMSLFVPRNWKIDDHCDCVASGIKNEGFSTLDNAISITLTGDVNFSEIKIIRI